MTKYQDWLTERARLGTIEGDTGEFNADLMQALDDEAVELMQTFAEALQLVADTFYGLDIGFPSLTCTEAENFYGAIHLIDPDKAEAFMRMHAEHDDPDEGDIHMTTDYPSGWGYR